MTEPRLHLASASRDLSAEACLFTLRVDLPRFPDEKNAASVDGDAVHEVSAMVTLGQSWDLREIVERHGAKYTRCEKLVAALLPWLDSLGDGFDAEKCFVYDARSDTARLGVRGDARTPFELAAIADLVQVVGTHAVVIDIKTGKPAYVKLSQLEVLAVAVARFYPQVETVEGWFAFVDEKAVHVEQHFFSPRDLDRIAANIEASILTIPESDPTPSAKNCVFCSVKPDACPQGAPFQKKRK